jgi:hypothetical protein
MAETLSENRWKEENDSDPSMPEADGMAGAVRVEEYEC